MNDVCESIELSDENLRWRARDVEFIRGSWRRLSATIPDFELQPFRMGEEEPDNPHLRAVVRIHKLQRSVLSRLQPFRRATCLRRTGRWPSFVSRDCRSAASILKN